MSRPTPARQRRLLDLSRLRRLPNPSHLRRVLDPFRFGGRPNLNHLRRRLDLTRLRRRLGPSQLRRRLDLSRRRRLVDLFRFGGRLELSRLRRPVNPSQLRRRFDRSRLRRHLALPRPRGRLRSFGSLVGELVGEFRRHWLRVRLGGLAAEIAFFSLLGLFPAVILFAGILGSLDAIIGAGAAGGIETWLLDRVVDAFGADSTLRATVADLFARSNAGFITIGAVLTLYASGRGFIGVVRALGVVYGHEHRRSWLSTRVVGFTITILSVVVAALMTAMVVVGPLLGSGSEVAERLGRGSGFAAAWVWLRWPLVYVVVVLWLAAVYHFAPQRMASWRWELPGAVVASVWWLVASTGFRIYLDLASGGDVTVFGLLGGALSLLFWLYLLALGLLVGAVINTVIATHRANLSPDPPDEEIPPTVTGPRKTPERESSPVE